MLSLYLMLQHYRALFALHNNGGEEAASHEQQLASCFLCC
jgi:hypothetical protein